MARRTAGEQAAAEQRARVAGLMLSCAVRVIGLLGHHRLHLQRGRLGHWYRIPDGRTYEVFRESSSDVVIDGAPVTLAVWFRLRWVPPGSRVRRFLFERESILNTLMFAGFDGYVRKLWMVDPSTCEYAGLYTWRGLEAADRYARYVTAVIEPLSVPGTVGYQIVDEPDLDHWTVQPIA